MQLSAVFAILLFKLALGKIYETVDDLVPNLGSYDYVVVGGESAGCAVSDIPCSRRFARGQEVLPAWSWRID
jgi:hypothetical protein